MRDHGYEIREALDLPTFRGGIASYTQTNSAITVNFEHKANEVGTT